jgi:pyruvate/2-oxoglutarate dehydrogenase complex dihydrolipoamide acyltransferase (E2) component
MAGRYTVHPFPLERRIIVDALRMGQNRRIINGLIEADVTDARRWVHDHNLSFTAFLIACAGKALAEYPEVHALQTWRGDLVVYDDVDISTLIETEMHQKSFPVAHVIHRANQRTIKDITEEIRSVQQQPQKSATLSYWKWVTKVFFRLPFFLRLPIYKLLMINPHRIQRTAGSSVLTSVGMFGNSGGWGLGIGIPLHNCGITIGGISIKPRLVDDQLQNREYLHITLSVNHDIVDGAPATRFASQFKNLIESCYGLTTT